MGGDGEQNQDAAANQNEDIPEDNNADESEEENLSDIDPYHNSLADYEPYEYYDMFSGERNDSELLNPIPIFENSCGDIPGNPSHRAYSQAMYPLALMDSEGVINPVPEVPNDRGKRKLEDMLESSEPRGTSKLTIRERGEGSGNNGEHNLGRGAVGPKPPQPP